MSRITKKVKIKCQKLKKAKKAKKVINQIKKVWQNNKIQLLIKISRKSQIKELNINNKKAINHKKRIFNNRT